MFGWKPTSYGLEIIMSTAVCDKYWCSLVPLSYWCFLKDIYVYLLQFTDWGSLSYVFGYSQDQHIFLEAFISQRKNVNEKADSLGSFSYKIFIDS